MTSKQEWKCPPFAALHWDSKLLPSLTNKTKLEERLAVVVGDSAKLLCVPSYMPGFDQKSGDIIANLMVNLLKQWDCAGAVVNMVFDTTASNTGHISASCVAVQQKLQKELLWSACRHHMGEVVVSHVFDGLKVEPPRGPKVSVFSRFSKNFKHLQNSQLISDMMSTLSSAECRPSALSFIEEQKIMVEELLSQQLTHRRED